MTAANALIRSLLVSPLLVGDLPDADQFNRELLSPSVDSIELNFDQKLGHLYEDALAILLESSPKVELLEKNLQVQESRHSTAGELDFLMRPVDGVITHLELAVKFYLAVKTGDSFTYPGPDSRDNYDRKIDRLLSHQLTLTKRYKDHLKPEYRAAEVAVKQLVYGCLFDHISEVEPSLPRFCNPDCRRGKWLHHSEVADCFSQESRFEWVPKHLWPVPFEFLNGLQLDEWLPSESVSRCQMVRVDGLVCPFFIAPDEFPKQSFVVDEATNPGGGV